MAVPAGLIFAIPDSTAIGAGWERVAELDGRFPKGAAAGADPGTGGGADTHTHNSPAHTHTGGSHQHTITATGASTSAALPGNAAAGTTVSANTHTHTVSPSSLQTFSLTAKQATFATAANDPPFVTVKWIRSLGTPAGVPVGAWGYWDQAALPSGWTSPSTARLKYLKGAAAAAEGGGSGGTSSAHSHAGASHDHPIGAHTHVAGVSGTPSSTVAIASSAAAVMASSSHTHNTTVAATPTTAASGATGAGTTGTQTNEPSHVRLGTIANGNASPDFPVGIIGGWMAPLSTLPGSLRICDGSGGTVDTRGKYIKGADVSGANFASIGTTGGAATHTHSNPSSHLHSDFHTHTVSFSVGLSGTAAASGSSGGIATGHGHAAVESASAGFAGGGSTIATVDAGDNEPLHRTIVWVKYIGSITVTVTSPTAGATLTGPTFTVTWTISAGTQTNYRVRIYASDQTSVVYDSGTVVSPTGSHAVPSSAGLRSGRTYYLQVSATNNSSIPGDSALQAFTTEWTPPAVVTGVTSSPIGGV